MGISSPSSLPEQWREFCSSERPIIVKIGMEKPFLCKDMGSVAEEFAQGKAVVEAQLPDGRRVLFDFLLKRCLDLSDGAKGNYRLLWWDARRQIYGNRTDPPWFALGQETDEWSHSSLRYQWRTFCRSGIPVLVDVRNGSRRSKLPDQFTSFLAAAFAQKKAVVEARIADGRRVLVDFLRKVIINLDDPSKRAPLTWFDSQGRFFTNGTVFGIDEQFVRRNFTDGTSGHFTPTSVQKCNLHFQRLNTFRVGMFPRPHVFGWYGTSASNIEEAAYGNGVININSNLLASGEAHGHGAHISPLSQPTKDMDKGGESHVLFCSLALGWQEVIPAGSHQDQPSSPIYDTGVDNKSDPSWHIFWSGRMQTQIAPLYRVSFIKKSVIIGRGPSPLSMYDDLTRFLPPSKLPELERCCERYLKSEIDGRQFADLLLEPRNEAPGLKNRVDIESKESTYLVDNLGLFLCSD